MGLAIFLSIIIIIVTIGLIWVIMLKNACEGKNKETHISLLRTNEELKKAHKAYNTALSYLKNSIYRDYKNIQVFFLGPIGSGKTSLINALANPWHNALVEEYQRTSKIEYAARTLTYTLNEISIRHPRFDFQVRTLPTIRLRFHDCPGELQYRNEILNVVHHNEKKDIILVLLYNIGFDNTFTRESIQSNENYYDPDFIRKLSELGHVIKIILVYNKVDLLPYDWTEDHCLEQIAEANQKTIYRIENIFKSNSNKLERQITCALNTGYYGYRGYYGVRNLIHYMVEHLNYVQLPQEISKRYNRR